MQRRIKKILYFVSRWYEGSAYKDINFMKDNFGGEIIKDDIFALRKSIEKMKPDLMVVRGDAKTDYQYPMKYNIPYILIEHDINSLRRELNNRTEMHDREKIENACAVIFTSEDHVKYYKKMEKKYGWKIPYYKVIHTRPLKKDLDFAPIEKLEGLHLVYAGGTVANWAKRNTVYGYRCYHEIFKKFIEAGWKVHIFSASHNQRRLREYRELGCITYNNLNYKELLKEMSKYTAGFHGYNEIGVPEKAFDYTQKCRGNKIWDYLASGIPTIGYQGGKGMKIYDGKWGIIIDDLEIETLNKIPERLAKIKITERMRYNYIMDKDLKKFKILLDMAIRDSKKIKRKVRYTIKEDKRIKDATRLTNHIKVYNKGAIQVYRGGYIFEPGTMSKELTINMRTYKEIKSHVSLVIEILK